MEDRETASDRLILAARLHNEEDARLPLAQGNLSCGQATTCLKHHSRQERHKEVHENHRIPMNPYFWLLATVFYK